MDVSKFKDVIQNVFKNYSSLLVPAVIGLVAVLLFVPTQLMSSKLRKQIADESISRSGRKVRSLSGSVVARDQHREEKKYQQDYKNDANKIGLLAKQSAQRELLSYKIFPEPRYSSVLIFKEFGQRFRTGIGGLLARVNARDCPTEVELERSLEGLTKSSKLSSKGTSHSKLNEARATIVDVLCREKAESSSVYANVADLSGYEFWGEYETTNWADAITDCWYWQLAYWITEDAIDSIDALNSGSNSVFTSPVKRLLSVSFPASGKGLRVKAKSKEKGADEKPKYVLSIKDVLTRPCTGRFSNNDVDIVHFNVVVVVSTRAILPFMEELCSAKQHKFKGWDGEEQEQVFKHNQITILESKIELIDREDNTHRRYRYGEDAVVELDLICEYIFNKAGYDKIKPGPVKESIEKTLKEMAEEKTRTEKRIKKKEIKKKKTETKMKTRLGRDLPEV
jgi:hypothetical protein